MSRSIRVLALSLCLAISLSQSQAAPKKAESKQAESKASKPASTTAPATSKEGWVDLFNGKDLTGWKQLNGTATYRAEDGAVVGTTVKGSPNSFLCTDKLYRNFELEFDVKVDPRLNSGVQIRSNSYPEYHNGRVHGYQVEIGNNKGLNGYIYDEARRAKFLSPASQAKDPETQKAYKVGEWNHYRVVCDGPSMKTWVNGVPFDDLTDDMTPCGFIGLQVHSFGGEPPAEVRWQNIRIKELPGAPAVQPPAPKETPAASKPAKKAKRAQPKEQQ
ncbi:MAG: DUF1080 domain-containing protein [Candidatus Sumerlaeota bacterium]|nr:DUF1080 domain-containing protein [Candidatus Sumerlaeota bacterium]